MENKKVSKKVLNSLLNDSMRGAIDHLELPKPTRKVKKLLDRTSRKLASAFARIIKKENKKSRKEGKNHLFVGEYLAGKPGRKSKRPAHKPEVVAG